MLIWKFDCFARSTKHLINAFEKFRLTFRTLFCTSGGIVEEPPLEGGAGAMLGLFDAL